MIQTENKIQQLKSLTEVIGGWNKSGLKTVFTNGCFDIVHLGHIDYLQKARNLGDKLIVGVNSDSSVKRLKGPTRPVVNEYARLRMIASFEFVDAVILFDEDTPESLIKKLKPNILVKGKDYTVENIVGANFVLENGGSVETIELVKGYSTSHLIDLIKKI